jgi:tryptophanyl-tRNA synthetase
MKRIFSGIQPSGILHIGNYFGAMKQWVELQHRVDEAIYCIVDLHAITVYQNPAELRENILSAAAWYIASGVDPEKSSIFVQSTRPEHTELAWILNCQAKMGELYRMTQFKDKSANGDIDTTGVGLFDYPVLMASDILLYKTNFVPVGDDQKQHVEFTRDLAQKFNSRFGDTFTLPEPIIKKETARIMGLDNPNKKMSKSASSPLNYIALNDNTDTILNKIKKAVTDSGTEIKYGEDKPALTNLLNIYAEVSGKNIKEIESDFVGRGYGDFKQSLAELLIEYLRPIQDKYSKLIADKSALEKILTKGSEKVMPLAEKTIAEVKKKVGLGT